MEFSSLRAWCKLDEFILFFSSHAQKEKKKWKPQPTLQHICKPTQAVLKPKACKRAAISPTHLG